MEKLFKNVTNSIKTTAANIKSSVIDRKSVV